MDSTVNDMVVSMYLTANARKPDWTGTLAAFQVGNPDLEPEGIAKLRDGWAWTFGGGAAAEVLVLPHHDLDAIVRKHTTWRGAADMIRDAFATFECRTCRGKGKAHDVTCEDCAGQGRTKNSYRPTLDAIGKGVAPMERTAIADYYDAVMKAQGDTRRAYRGGK